MKTVETIFVVKMLSQGNWIEEPGFEIDREKADQWISNLRKLYRKRFRLIRRETIIRETVVKEGK